MMRLFFWIKSCSCVFFPKLSKRSRQQKLRKKKKIKRTLVICWIICSEKRKPRLVYTGYRSATNRYVLVYNVPGWSGWDWFYFRGHCFQKQDLFWLNHGRIHVSKHYEHFSLKLLESNLLFYSFNFWMLQFCPSMPPVGLSVPLLCVKIP